jgi:chromosome segregation ATPase
MNSSPDVTRVYHELQSRSLVTSERERVLQQKRSALADLRTQVRIASESAQRDKNALCAAQQKFSEAKRAVDDKVMAKQTHNNGQMERLSQCEQHEEYLKQQIAAVTSSIESTRAAIERKQLEGNALADAEERLKKAKLQLEEDDNALMQLEQTVSRDEAAAMKRHNRVAESVPHFPLPQVTSPGSAGGLEATATESIILIDDARV